MLFTSSIVLDVVLTLLIGVLLIYWYISRRQKYWAKRGVTTPEIQPIFGHFFKVALAKMCIGNWIKEIYDTMNEHFFGVYAFDEPYLVIKDAQLVKKVLIQDFSHFVDRNIAAPDHSPLVQNMLFLQKSPAWRHGRAKLLGAFTSGKLKTMFPLFKISQVHLADYLKQNQTVLEARELAAKFTIDLISRCAFGIESFCYDSTISTFRYYSKKCFEPSLRNMVSQTLHFFKPSWVSYFKLHFMPEDALNYFADAFWTTMENRTDNNRVNDLIDILNDLKKSKEINAENRNFICGMAIQFYLASYEAASTAISFTLYELARKPYIQDRLRQEIRTVIKNHGNLNYEAIADMPYLDMCIQETLRMYPPLPFLERKCNKDFPIPDSNFLIEKGTTILIPVYGLQMDKQFFDNPDHYDPERFKKKIDNNIGVYYLPFGDGPRGCLGEKFGRLSVKMAIITVILNHEVTMCKQTPDPVEFDPKSTLLQSTVGLPLLFNPLTK